MFSQFFIKRPIFATVISIIIVVAGLVTLRSLPVAQYPEIAPPTVQVSAVYPGASAKTVAETVAQPIEETINGVENMLYMSSKSSNDGAYSLTITFELGTDMDVATVLVQNRVAQALSSLPEEVQRMGVNTQKTSTAFVLFASLFSDNPEHDALFLANYATLRIKNELARIKGVGSVMVFGGANYSMRIWLNPEKLKERNLTTNDVVRAIREQNMQVAAGQIGQNPSPNGQNFQFTVNVEGRLNSEKQFSDIIIKSDNKGQFVRIKDVAKVELGAVSYDMLSQVKGKPSPIIAVLQQPGANALEVGANVKKKLAELSKSFPEDVKYEVPFDTTLFVDASISEVVQTISIAILLVFLVILAFLQNWRATIIPAATIPVSLIGTFGVMSLFGVSVNMLSLFGIVLAIGVVVDDAIVVVENVSRNIDESGLSPQQATIQAMKEVTGPIIATTLVLLSVFIPTAFIGSITGQLYRQFALTIAAATFFSSINALTLSPALSALLLRPTKEANNLFSSLFNKGFSKGQGVYFKFLNVAIRKVAITFIIFIIISVAAYLGYGKLPKDFVPKEDQGFAIVSAQLPDASSLQRTGKVVDQINDILKNMKGIENYVGLPGQSLMDNTVAPNAATFYVIFDDWDKRLKDGLTADVLVGQMFMAFSKIKEANVMAFAPPAIFGLGSVGGFQLEVQDRAGIGLDKLQQNTMNYFMKANSEKGLQGVYSMFRANIPQILADVDRNQVKMLGLNLNDVFETLQANLGSVYVNDFNKFGRTYQVKVQAEAPFRSTPEDIRKLEVRNNKGEMVPLGSVITLKNATGPQVISRYNMYPSASVFGSAAPGFSSGLAMDKMEQLADKLLPETMGYEWTGMSFQEKIAGTQTFFIFSLAVLFIYLVLCAQYESWTLPLTVILSVPLALLGTVLAVFARGMTNNVYTQIGIVLLIALTCKTAILISEFARENRKNGMSIIEAALTAAKLRLRPILMTAFTFILGVVPLVIASGAGSESRKALGTAVFGGMLSATMLLVIFVPVFYVGIMRMSKAFNERKKKKEIEE